MSADAPSVTYELINDPVEAAAIAEQCRINKVLADQVGCTPEWAGLALWQFFNCATPDDWPLQ